MPTYNHAFSMNFIVSGLSSEDREHFTNADRLLVIQALVEAASNHVIVQDLEAGWTDVVMEEEGNQ